MSVRMLPPLGGGYSLAFSSISKALHQQTHFTCVRHADDAVGRAAIQLLGTQDVRKR